MANLSNTNQNGNSLKGSIIDLMSARREDAYHGILDSNGKYSKCKDTVEKCIDKIREIDPKTADKLEKSFSYIEETITLELYNKGFYDGQELHLLAHTTVKLKGDN